MEDLSYYQILQYMKANGLKENVKALGNKCLEMNLYMRGCGKKINLKDMVD